MTKIIKILFVLLFISSLTTVVASCEEQYNHIWSAESSDPQSGIWFGYHFDIAEDYIITNEHKGSVDDISTAGTVYLYDLEGNLINTIQSPNPDEANEFGRYLDTYEDLIALSEWGAHINGVKWVGKVYVFNDKGTLQYTLQPEKLYLSANFGSSVEFGDELLLISERGVELSPPSPGMVHIYKHDGEYVNTIYSPEPKPDGSFGSSMEIGAEHIYLAQDESVYIYDLEGVLVNTIQAPEPAPAWTLWNGSFGNSIDVSGDILVVGEMDARVNGVERVGKVHIYSAEGEFLRTLLSPNPDTNALFGFDVAISGDIIVVGEMQADIAPFLNEGKAYVFNVDGTLLQNLTAPEPTPRGAYGYAIDIQDDIMLIGEGWAVVEGHSNCGRIHFYKLGAPVEVQEQVEETTLETDEPDADGNGWIPGYPLESLVLGLASIVLISYLYQRKR